MALTDQWTMAQRSVIGSMLIDPDCIARVVTEMRREDFSGILADIFTAIKDMISDGQTVDPVTVLGRIGDQPPTRELIRTLLRETPTSANVDAYVSICREQSRLMLLNRIGAELGTSLSLSEAEELVSKAAAISMETDNGRGVSAAQAVTAWWESFVSGETPDYIKCGIACIDNTIRTVSGNYNIIAGYTSHGKSAIAIQMAWNIAEKRKVGFFAYECSQQEWTERLLTYVGQVDYGRVRDRTTDEAETKKLSAAAAKIYERDIHYEDASGYSVKDILATCIRKRFDVIFVDYLQLVKSPFDKYGRLQAVTDISLSLREMASKHAITVFALSQLSRAPKAVGEFAMPPALSDLRESGQLEQDANAVIMVHAPMREKVPTFRLLTVLKNRNGKTGWFYADFHGDVQTFAEPSPDHLSKYVDYTTAAKLGIAPQTGKSKQLDNLEREYRKRKEREREE